MQTHTLLQSMHFLKKKATQRYWEEDVSTSPFELFIDLPQLSVSLNVQIQVQIARLSRGKHLRIKKRTNNSVT